MKRWAIGRIALRAARVTMTNPILKGGGITLDLPDVEIRDLGKRSGGVTAAQAARAVTAALLSRTPGWCSRARTCCARGAWRGRSTPFAGWFAER